MSVSYTLNVENLYFTPEINYQYISNIIENYGLSRKGIYYSTYVNLGHFSQASAGANASYRFKWGRVYAGGGWKAYYYTGQSSKNAVYASCGFNSQVKDFSFNGDLEYNSKDYTALSCTTYERPSTANIQINYHFTPDFYAGVACSI